jgi:hypothetical protein
LRVDVGMSDFGRYQGRTLLQEAGVSLVGAVCTTLMFLPAWKLLVLASATSVPSVVLNLTFLVGWAEGGSEVDPSKNTHPLVSMIPSH